jgi:Cdc6-like AAA superfamily ATPase
VSELGWEHQTIVTPAVRWIREQVDRYLGMARASAEDRGRSPDRLADTGGVIAIAGEYGTGKTHLAMDVLDRVRAAGDTRPIYQLAPGGTFVTLYTELMQKEVISRADVRARVLETYADIVADQLAGQRFTEEIVRQLGEGEIDPRDVVERLGLMEGALLQQLRNRIRGVTGDPIFGVALPLLLSPALENAVWDWLAGRPPDQVLVERGVSDRIKTDRAALEALAVLALLFGRTGHPFVLIIDEMQNLLLSTERPAEYRQAVKQLFEAFRSAGGLLVVCGLPDMLEALLPQDTGRVEPRITPSTLSVADVRWYVEESQHKAFGERTLAPFTDDSVGYLVRLTGGVARPVIKMCYHAYEQAAETGREVTRALLREVARRLSADSGMEEVRSRVRDVLEREGHRIVAGRADAGSPRSLVDFWVPAAGSEEAGCGIVITGAVLQEEYARELGAIAAAIRADNSSRAALLVVNGWVASEFASLLAAAFDAEPLVYDVRRFEAEFIKEFRAIMSRLAHLLDRRPEGTGETPQASVDVDMFRVLRDQIERIGRQQDYTHQVLRDLEARQAEAGSELAVVRTGLASVIQRAGSAERWAEEPGRLLPSEVEGCFDVARERLRAFGDIDALLQEVFAASYERSGDGGERLSLAYQLRTSEVFAAVGVAELLRSLLRAFHDSVGDWLESAGEGDESDRLADDDLKQLRAVCRTFDALHGTLPFYLLDGLVDLTGPTRVQPLSRAAKGSLRSDLREALDGLGERVYAAVVDVRRDHHGRP